MADLHFPSRREELTVLTQEQVAYIRSKLDAQLVPVFTQDHSGSYSLSLQIPVQSSRCSMISLTFPRFCQMMLGIAVDRNLGS